MKFRYHRGGFAESMNTCFEICGKDALKKVLVRIGQDLDLANILGLCVNYYGYDDRLCSTCYIVTCKLRGVVGFLWEV